MQYGEKSLLRFTTTGSVDDGKSTLIGRLLYETKSIYEDQYAAIEKTSKRKGFKEVDLAYLLDGPDEHKSHHEQHLFYRCLSRNR